MTRLLGALALILAMACPWPAMAQKVVGQPAATVPQTAVCYGALGTPCLAVTVANPLPVTGGGGGGSATPFAPTGNATLAVTTTTARVALPSADTTLVVQNLGANTADLRLGTVSVNALTTDTPLQPGGIIVLATGANTHLAAITASGTATLAITTGTGVPTLGYVPDPVGVSPVSLAALPALATGANVIGGVTQSGTWNVGSITTLPAIPTGANTIGTVNLGTIAGVATAAKQPALGTAGTASTDVITVQGAAGMTPMFVTGNVAAGATDAGNPVKFGGVYNATPPTYTTTQRGDVQIGTRGALAVQVMLADGTTTQALATAAADASPNARAGFYSHGYPYGFNGTSWDRQRGSTTGLAVQPYGILAQRWAYAAAASGILNTTTAVTIRATAGAGLRNCLVSLDIMAEALGTATEVAVRDGAGGTVLWRTKIGTGGLTAGRTVHIPAPVCGTANTLMEVVTLTASGTGAVYLNASGNIEP